MTPGVEHILPILQGAVIALAVVVALFFWRFYRVSRTLLFGLFSVAFLIMACNWAVVAVMSPSSEEQPYYYLVRLLAYAIILGAILDQNRRPR